MKHERDASDSLALRGAKKIAHQKLSANNRLSFSAGQAWKPARPSSQAKNGRKEVSHAKEKGATISKK